MKGRPFKPTGLKVIEGNRGRRPLNNREPDPDYLDQLDPPKWLPDGAKEVWTELAFKLRKAKVLTVIDVPGFEQLCVTVSQFRYATKQLKLEDSLQQKDKDKKGNDVPSHQVMNPWLIIQSMAFKQSIRMMCEFGMTPAARSRVMVEPQLALFGDENEETRKQKEGAGYFTGA